MTVSRIDLLLSVWSTMHVPGIHRVWQRRTDEVAGWLYKVLCSCRSSIVDYRIHILYYSAFFCTSLLWSVAASGVVGYCSVMSIFEDDDDSSVTTATYNALHIPEYGRRVLNFWIFTNSETSRLLLKRVCLLQLAKLSLCLAPRRLNAYISHILPRRTCVITQL